VGEGVSGVELPGTVSERAQSGEHGRLLVRPFRGFCARAQCGEHRGVPTGTERLAPRRDEEFVAGRLRGGGGEVNAEVMQIEGVTVPGA